MVGTAWHTLKFIITITMIQSLLASIQNTEQYHCTCIIMLFLSHRFNYGTVIVNYDALQIAGRGGQMSF